MLKRHAYLVLALPETASEDEIRSTWRKKARLHHPDSPYGDMAAFLKAKTAFETLIPPPAQKNPRRVRVQASSRRAG